MSNKVLALVGSPRKNGNSDLLTASFLQGIGEKGVEGEALHLNRLKISPCQACDGCARDGICVIPDDMQDIYRKVHSSSGLLLVSPIYFGSLSAQSKIFMDRFQCWWQAKYRLQKPFIADEEKRPAFFICVGAREDRERFEDVCSLVRLFFSIIGFRLFASLCFGGHDHRGSVGGDSEALKTVRRAAHEFVSQIGLTKALRE